MTDPTDAPNAQSEARPPASSAAQRAPHGLWLKDHRGRSCRVHPGRGAAATSGSAPAPAEGDAALDEHARPGVDWSFTLPLIGCLGFIGAGACVMSALGYAALSTLTKQAPILPPLVLAFVVAGLYVAWAFWRRRVLQRRGLAQHHAQAWLARGRCPGCGYSLRGLQPAGDGCRVCPECGGAWRIAPAAPAGDRPTGTA